MQKLKSNFVIIKLKAAEIKYNHKSGKSLKEIFRNLIKT